MSLHATTPRKERLLAFGRSNSGRSSTYLNIADWAARTNADTHIYLALTDRSWDAMRFDEIDPYVTVTDLERGDYMAWVDWAKTTVDKVRADDWLVVDRIDEAWEAAQEFYWDRLTGGDMLADVYFRNQQAMKSKGAEGEYMAGDHGANWGLIKKYYRPTRALQYPLYRGRERDHGRHQG